MDTVNLDQEDAGMASAMKSPSVTSGWFEDEPTVVLRYGSSVLEVALFGATVLRWMADLGEGPVDLLDGYRDADELRSQDGVRNGVMAPFCDRIADARYSFDNTAYDLLPGESHRLVYHGMVRLMPFALGGVTDGEDGVEATFVCHGLVTEPYPGYPFPVEVQVAYRLTAASLSITITGLNHGTAAAPFAAGWHPYVRLPRTTTITGLDLRVPSTVQVETDAGLIPYPGDQAYSSIGPDVARWDPIGDAVLDVGFLAGSEPAVLRDPTTGVQVSLSQDRGLVHLFTGDTIGRDRRVSVAVEPVETMTDAFNRPDCATAIRLEPGARRSFSATVTVSHLSHDS